ncbi:MAG: four helix bundle protein [Bacteroidota bacterium]|nr:four helix bundle protein [Bacteroidota bacterium]
MLQFKIYSFETLEVWKETRSLVTKIYCLTKSYPSDEKYGLVSQMRRAAVSVSSNLAEGSSRKSFKDQSRFSEIAYGSLMELLCESLSSFDIGYITEQVLNELRTMYDRIGSKLTGLRDSQIKRFEKAQLRSDPREARDNNL